ncbi:MAG TPA: enoyl-CoA hydratase/isomerase family protein [Bradyrhizobium sp.]|nr:enoyl-CoA hydratase/isomerase family protein [Bradyrhizobium sp.]
MTDFAASTLDVDLEGGALTVWLSRPDARNAISLQMCDDLCRLFELLRFASGIHIVILRGRGPSFCAGVDLKEFAGKDLPWMSRRRHRGLDAYLAIEQCPIPTLSVAHGALIGGGCEIAAACDFIFSLDTAFFRWPEAMRGGVGATQRLPRAVGRAMAKELLFTGRTVSAAEAERIGLVNRVCVGTEALESAVGEAAAEICRGSSACIRLIKQAMNNGENCDRTTAISIERQAIDHSLEVAQTLESHRQILPWKNRADALR